MSAPEQLSFLQPVNEREVRKAVVKELKAYTALRVAVQNKQEQTEKRIDQLFPECTFESRPPHSSIPV
ncbi:hypothetical protein [Brevibacillus sp. 179-C9.3 HS]|uniref:hypothetical protein n=1 Tax=unclassified Brevibacillus TaxID=2684853 RepID=UPI0039A07732